MAQSHIDHARAIDRIYAERLNKAQRERDQPTDEYMGLYLICPGSWMHGDPHTVEIVRRHSPKRVHYRLRCRICDIAFSCSGIEKWNPHMPPKIAMTYEHALFALEQIREARLKWLEITQKQRDQEICHGMTCNDDLPPRLNRQDIIRMLGLQRD